ncbi:MAG: hypothetical protein COA82_05205 [Alkaliphilus sp.]|nr:hypothetical protein [Alkaliphilus transvaalensis]PHS35273.1 MAG: hypothetical protein COA82_05205 [Alkaliphilus sp.]
MDYNSYTIIIGCVVVLVSLALIIRENRLYNIKNRNNDNYRNQSNCNASKEVAIISNKIEQLARNVELILEATVSSKETKNVIKKPIAQQDNNSFNNTLKYQLFEKKNEKVIELHKSGLEIASIAKMLNKSYREVEMIVKLLK